MPRRRQLLLLLLLLSTACAGCLLWAAAMRAPGAAEAVRGAGRPHRARAQVRRLGGGPVRGLPDVYDDDGDEKSPYSPRGDERPNPDETGKPMRIVHLDLKGAPPKMSYLHSLLPLMAQAGANGLLLEYEDMFPYTGTLSNVSALNAYSMEEVQELLVLARRHRLEVIPLVQTFGHLELALKLPEFRRLREVPSFPQELCPSRPEALDLLVGEMVRQVLGAHPGARFLHVGCDEVYHLGACELCAGSLKEPRQLFAEHVARVARHVRGLYPGVTPLVWDDMMRQWTVQQLERSGLAELVEPVVWAYTGDISRLVPPYVWHMYGRVFPHVWVAGAFKGAQGETALVPDLRRTFDNHVAWRRLMRSMSLVRHFRGIVLTGWSRYDHFAVLCELLPAAVPSLALNLLALSADEADTRHQHQRVFSRWTRLLSCFSSATKVSYASLSEDPYQWRLSGCSFPGSDVFSVLASYGALRDKVHAVHSELTERSGWLTDYHVSHNFSSPWRVASALSAAGADRLAPEVGGFRELAAQVLARHFDGHTVAEWLEQKVEPLERKAGFLEKSARRLMDQDTWPRRPLQ
ncbi:hexosaminidase D-like [Bacillus rossius redtenbacheri]|uniref:hexosaminidase D-like n=1 Tax=Bacillus rossius redtenbacheri TaxID=93214 RepID=UPI002FDEEBF3